MATKDGKTFGMFELETLYDYMMDHKDYSFKTFVNYAMKVLDMSEDIAIEAVVAMRKERRKSIMVKSAIDAFICGQVEAMGNFIQRDNLVQNVMETWMISQQVAEDLVDNAIVSIPNPDRIMIQYNTMASLTKALDKMVGRLPPASNEERVCDPEGPAAQSFYQEAKMLGEEMDARTRPEPFEGIFLDRLGNAEKMLLKIIEEGEVARDTGDVSPYRGDTLAHCLHATGFLMRDLALALEKATGGTYKARQPRWKTAMDASTRPEHYRSPGSQAGVSASVDLEDFDVGNLIQKYKGYRFPGEVVSRFTTRKGKVRYVVEGIADGNDECLHIFSASDLRTLTVEHGWVYSSDGNWWWSIDYPTERHDSGSIRPATQAEKQFIRTIAERTPKPSGPRKG